ncbi:MAG: AzlC family ABC transporter permease [Thaumarchaeota archaeon]|nr:AzlC family ABC transporter permease [Nitrososphaerota archaeon]
MAKVIPDGWRTELLAGTKAVLPILLGVIPFGLTYGVLAVGAGLPVAAAVGMSSILFAGSSQFVSIQLFSAAVPLALILLTVLIVNLRHLLYSASMAPHLRELRLSWKVILSYLLTDEAYVVTITHYNKAGALINRQWYFLGAGFTMWGAWQVSTFVGVFLGTLIPSNLSLEFAVTLTFIALLVPNLKDRPSVITAITSGIIAVIAINLPFRLNILVAAILALGVGLLAGRLQHKDLNRT